VYLTLLTCSALKIYASFEINLQPRSSNLLQLNFRIFIHRNMIISSYLPDISHHVSWICRLSGFLPYEFNKEHKLLVVSKLKKKRTCYKVNLLLSLLNTTLTWLRLKTQSYNIFITILGITWASSATSCLLARWNFDCDPKYVNVLNKLILFEKYLTKTKPVNQKGIELQLKIISVLRDFKCFFIPDYSKSTIEKCVPIATKMFCISIPFIFMLYAPIVYLRPCYPRSVGSFTMVLGALNLILVWMTFQDAIFHGYFNFIISNACLVEYINLAANR